MTLRCGSIQYATDQGIAHLCKDFYDAGLVTDVMVFQHGSRPCHAKEWYGPDVVELAGRPFNGPVVDAFLAKVDVMLFFETPFDWSFLSYCRERGVRTAIMPMYECCPRQYTPSVPGYDRATQPDKWICPSLLDVEYFPGSPFVPVPLPPTLQPWQLRTTAKTFLHNGGNLGLRGHKGTREIMLAMQHVKSPIQLTIRAQDDAGLHKLLREVPSALSHRDPRITYEFGNRPRETLFDGHDVFIMAEKYNGLSLPLAEARGCGMVVMTSDRFPMNTWLPTGPLIPVSGYSRATVGGPYNHYDEARVDPETIAEKIDEVYKCEYVEGYSHSAVEWRKSMSWETLKPKWIEVLS